jgi:2'-5' RNA ligase
MNQSALFVVVPEAEPLVQALRSRFDPSAQVGVPAHITVLFPFMPRELLTDAVLRRLRTALGAFTSFTFALERIGRFPRTTYLMPEPPVAFVAITAALAREFPGYPPYGGQFSQVIPHLTVADQSEEFASVAEHELAGELERRGGVNATCSAVELFENSSEGYWRRFESFALSGGV